MSVKSFRQYIDESPRDPSPRDLSSYRIVKPNELYSIKHINVPGVGRVPVRVPLNKPDPESRIKRQNTKPKKPGRNN